MTNDIIIDNKDLSIESEDIAKANAKALVVKIKATKSTKATITKAQKETFKQECIKEYLAEEKAKIDKIEQDKIDEVKNFDKEVGGQMIELEVTGFFKTFNSKRKIPFAVTVKMPKLLFPSWINNHLQTRYLTEQLDKIYFEMGVEYVIEFNIISKKLLCEPISFFGKKFKDLDLNDYQDIATHYNLRSIGSHRQRKTMELNRKIFADHYIVNVLKQSLSSLERENKFSRRTVVNYNLLDNLVIKFVKKEKQSDNNVEELFNSIKVNKKKYDENGFLIEIINGKEMVNLS